MAEYSRMKGMIASLIACALMVTLVPFFHQPAVATADESVRFPVTRTEQELVAFWKRSKPEFTYDFMVKPGSYEKNYKPPMVDERYYIPGLHLLNFLRYSAGLNGDVKLDRTLSQKAQYHADVQVLNKGMSMDQPSIMTDEVYQQAKLVEQAGFSSSLIGLSKVEMFYHHWQIERLFRKFPYNTATLLLLNPSLSKIGFGAGAANYEAFVSALTDVEIWDSDLSDYDAVAYPGQGNFPAEFFYPNDPWTLMLNKDKFNIRDLDKVNVEMKRLNDGKEWTISAEDQDTTFIPVIDSGAYLQVLEYSHYYLLTFRPSKVRSIHVGDEYRITVHGLQKQQGEPMTLSYQSKFVRVDASQREFSELPHDVELGVVAMLKDWTTNELIGGIKVELYKDDLRLVSESETLTSWERVGDPVYLKSLESNETGAIIIQDTTPAHYSFQYVSRTYRPDLNYTLSVELDKPNAYSFPMYKLDVWGKILRSDGRPLGGIMVIATDKQGKETRVVTNRLGEYGFPHLIRGESYAVRVVNGDGPELVPENEVTIIYDGSYRQLPTSRHRSLYNEDEIPVDARVVVDGRDVHASANMPLLHRSVRGNPLVPLKLLNAYLDQPFQLVWQQSAGQVTFMNQWNTPQSLKLSSSYLYAGESQIDLGDKPQIINGSIYVPLILFAEAMDYNIVYNKATKALSLTKIDV